MDCLRNFNTIQSKKEFLFSINVYESVDKHSIVTLMILCWFLLNRHPNSFMNTKNNSLEN